MEPTYKPDWEIPGGVVEQSETPSSACRRECREELGIDVAIGRLLVIEHRNLPNRGDSAMLVYDGGVIATATPITVPPGELRSYRFAHEDDLASVAPPRIERRLKAAFARTSRGHPDRTRPQNSAHLQLTSSIAGDGQRLLPRSQMEIRFNFHWRQ